ncbi:MAG: hypothetical protein R3331_11690 [Sulfurospirillaceae bacterium]|nr:hypothetical protein [Sulfurospirillaceae bacterium]
MRIVFVFVFLVSIVFGNDLNISSDTNLTQEASNLTISSNDKNDSNETNATNLIDQKQTIFLSYQDVPDKVFVGQIFPIKVKALVSTQDFDEIKNNIIKNNGIDILNTDENWKWKNNELFFKTFYFKVVDKNATFPEISFDLYKDGNITNSQLFPPLSLNIINLNADKYFSNVIADSLDIIKSKTSNFDEKNLITVLEIEAKNSNLKDFKLSTVLRDGIDSAEDNTPYYKIYYYAIIPKHTESLTFTYFNTKENNFVKKSVDIVVDNDDVSTQSNLNPKDDGFKIYKNAMYGLFAIIFLILAITRRRVIYLLLLVFTVIMFFINMNPLSSIKISADTKVYILPTRNSTVFFVTPRIIYAQKIKKINNYIKIILPNGKIGWIKDANVIKN